MAGVASTTRRAPLTPRPARPYTASVPLTPPQLLDNVVRRVTASYEEDERVAAALHARLPEAARLITETLGPRRIVLYGSLATGLFFAARSDVDLAVGGIGEEAPDELLAALHALLGRRVDVVDPELVAPHIRRDIEQRGVVVHEPSRQG